VHFRAFVLVSAKRGVLRTRLWQATALEPRGLGRRGGELRPGRPAQPRAALYRAAETLDSFFTARPMLGDALGLTRRIRTRAAQLGARTGAAAPLSFSSFDATRGATEQEAQRLVREKREAIDDERGRAGRAHDRWGRDLGDLPSDDSLPGSASRWSRQQDTRDRAVAGTRSWPTRSRSASAPASSTGSP
jgi:hypothetical protein